MDAYILYVCVYNSLRRIILYIIINMNEKHFKNEQRRRDAAAKKS